MEDESDAANGEVSEAEDLILSDVEEATSSDQDVVLKIDYNARIITRELKDGGNEDGDEDYDMHFFDKNDLARRTSESGLQTSTEDLNISDDDEKCQNSSIWQSVNLDGITSISAEDMGSASTLESHTVFKSKYNYDSEFVSAAESDNMKENFIKKDKIKSLPTGLMVPSLSSVVKTASSVVFPATQKALNSLNIKNVYANSLLLDEDVQGLQDEKDSPPMTCLEFLKSEFSDGNNTDAEDLSLGSLDDIGERHIKVRNPSEKSCNMPVLLSELSSASPLSCGVNGLGESDSRRSSNAEFQTEDETFQMEDFPDHRRLKKRNFRLVEKNEKSDSGTDEEVL